VRLKEGALMSEFIDVREKARQIVTDPYGLRKVKKVQYEHEITDEMIEECYKTAAKIVKQYGEAYLPIFERMHAEREKRQKNRDLMELALGVAN
jgi:hypothetical protein